MDFDRERAKQELLKKMLTTQIILIDESRPFQWRSGIHSPIYIDLRRMLGYVDLRNMIVDALEAFAYPYRDSVQVVAGVATGGIPLATMLADRWAMPLAYVRPQPKEYGLGKQVEGGVVAYKKILLIEELISTGGSAANALEALEMERAEPEVLISVFSYEFPEAKERFANYNWERLTTIFDLMEVLEPRRKKIIREWLRELEIV
ncbi:MAG: orotate phosphoribosyltransferase [Chlorobi bacterium]|nr:orotate phosphoribosyltransferase [Chlorobiota bacterium]